PAGPTGNEADVPLSHDLAGERVELVEPPGRGADVHGAAIHGRTGLIAGRLVLEGRRITHEMPLKYKPFRACRGYRPLRPIKRRMQRTAEIGRPVSSRRNLFSRDRPNQHNTGAKNGSISDRGKTESIPEPQLRAPDDLNQ